MLQTKWVKAVKLTFLYYLSPFKKPKSKNMITKFEHVQTTVCQTTVFLAWRRKAFKTFFQPKFEWFGYTRKRSSQNMHWCVRTDFNRRCPVFYSHLIRLTALLSWILCCSFRISQFKVSQRSKPKSGIVEWKRNFKCSTGESGKPANQSSWNSSWRRLSVWSVDRVGRSLATTWIKLEGLQSFWAFEASKLAV